MLVLMTVLVVFARIAKTASAEIQAPALVFTWFALLLTMATAFLLFTSVFFVTPVDLKRVFSLIEPSSSKGIAPPDVAAAENEQTPLNLKTAQVKPMDSHRPPDDAGTFGIRVQNAPTPHDFSNEQLVKISMSNFRPGRLADSQLSLASQTPTGLKVVNVLASSSASKAGVRKNDLITKIGDEPIWNIKQWVAWTDDIKQDQIFDMQVWRDSAPMDLKIHLTNRLKLFKSECAVKQGDACYRLGLIYEEGDVLPKDIPRAKFYFDLACTLRSGPTCTELGILTERPSLIGKGCSLGDGGGCREQGESLEPPNLDVATQALKASCDLGDSFACSDLTSHLNADSRPQQAKQLSRRACWWGEQEACKSVDPITYADIVEETHRHTERHRVKR